MNTRVQTKKTSRMRLGRAECCGSSFKRIGWRSPEIETAPVLDSAAQSLSDNQFTVLVKTEAEEELTQRTFDEAQLRVLQKWQDKFSTFSRAA